MLFSYSLEIAEKYFVNISSDFFLKIGYNISEQRYQNCTFTLANKCFLADEATIERII
jgi:uracil-DNA glycosylase